MEAKEYVLGFLFDPSYERVVLIRKNRPEWQHGLLNGVGGKIEPNESMYEAMLREFHEEAGLYLLMWKKGYAFTMQGEKSIVHVFRATDPYIETAKSMTDEKITVYKVKDVLEMKLDITDNIQWIIQACISMQRHKFKITKNE